MKQTTFLKFFSWIPVILAFVWLHIYGLNTAHWDDHAVKYSVQKVLESTSIFEKIKLLAASHNEHRIFTSRLVALLTQQCTGFIDFKWMMVVGSTFLIGIWLILRKLSNNNFVFFFASFLIFIPSFQENALWGMASIQNFGVLFFVILGIYFLAKTNVANAFFCFLIALFTSLNAVIIFPAILLYFLLRLEFKQFFKWSLLAGMLLTFFFIGYAPVSGQNIAIQLVKIPFLFLKLTGNILDFKIIFGSLGTHVFILVGFISLIAFLYQTYRIIKHKRRDLLSTFFVITGFFILATIAGTVFARGGAGEEIILGSKYKIYPILFFILNLGFEFDQISRRKRLAIFLIFFVSFINYFIDFREMNYTLQNRKTEYFNNYLSTQNRIKDLPIIKEINPKFDAPLSPQTISFDFSENPETYSLASISKVSAVIQLKNDSLTLVYPMRSAGNSMKEILKQNLGMATKSIAQIPKIGLVSGKYSLYLIEENKKYLLAENKFLQGEKAKEVIKNW